MNEVILDDDYHTVWKLGTPNVAGVRSPRFNGITHFAGTVLGERDTAQLGVMLLPSPKQMLSLQSVRSRFFGFQ